MRLELLFSLLVTTPFMSGIALADCDAVITVHCGQTPTSAYHDGRLWTVFVSGSHVYVTDSDDLGETFSTPRQINTEPETIYANGENRPKLVLADEGSVLVSWTQKTEGRFAGDIRFSRSDDGVSFSDPLIVNDDGLQTSHRFDGLGVTPSGLIYLAWLDKRDLVASRSSGEPYKGAALYYAVSKDGGRTFRPNLKVADHSCECCRLAMVPEGSDQMAVLWRQIFDNRFRDHAIAVLGENKAGRLKRVTYDDWAIDACPHHGPHMDASGQAYHLVWFTGPEERAGIYYGRYHLSFGLQKVSAISSELGAAHPQVFASDQEIVVVWKQFDGSVTRLMARISRDGGETFSDPINGPATDGASDHPLLVGTDSSWLVSWWTRAEGLRVLKPGDFGVEMARL